MFLYGTTQFVSGNEKFGSFFGARTIGCWINHFGSCLFCLVFAVLVGAGWLWVGCFVNCIVDVSVFVDAFFEFLNLLFLVCSCFVSCYGRSVDVLARVADEGRGGLRYSLGSWRASVDLGVSEWGNLVSFLGATAC